MIYKEAWYKETLERDLQRGKLLTERWPTDENLIHEALQSWRSNKTSHLETIAGEDAHFANLLMDTAQKAGFIPYTFMPEVYFSSRYNDLPKGRVWDLAFEKFPQEKLARKWVFNLLNMGMDFGENTPESQAIVHYAIEAYKQNPKWLIELLKQDTLSNVTLGGIRDEGVFQKFFDASVEVAEDTKNPHVLKWVWEPDIYEYWNGDSQPPDLGWDAIFATPEDALPSVSYQVYYHDLLGDFWNTDEGDKGEVPLSQFARLYDNWDSFDWVKPGVNEAWHLEIDASVIEHEDEESDEEPIYSKASIAFPGEPPKFLEWLMDRWPPPNRQ